MEVEIDPSKQKKGMQLREAIMGLESSSRMSALATQAAGSYLNFLQRIAPHAGPGHLRSG